MFNNMFIEDDNQEEKREEKRLSLFGVVLSYLVRPVLLLLGTKIKGNTSSSSSSSLRVDL